MGGPATVNTSRLSGNGVRATAPAGTATASAGALSTGDQAVATTVDDSVISANHISAASTGGRAIVFGAGLANGGLLTVTNTAVVANRGHAAARRGSAHGGGIWNSSFAGRPPFGELRLQGSVVSGNALTVEGAITSAGGGLYTDGPVTLAQDHIVGNAPDNCSGVSC
jgi:hypothetical protein